MLNGLPVIGWILSVVLSISFAVPFWICWTVCGIGQSYFYFMPKQWQSIPFWNCVGLFIVASIIRTFLPSLASVSQTVNAGKK